MSSSSPLLAIANLSLTLGGVSILEQVSLELERGQIHALVGPNGAGKTSLLRCLLGEYPHRGEITLHFEHGGIGYVPQFLEIDPSLPVTVLDFLRSFWDRRALFLPCRPEVRSRALVALRRTGCEHLLGRAIGSLSGGEFRRVLLAQALEPLPELLLLDEPASNIDAAGARQIEHLLRELQREHGLTVLLVAHDLTRVLEFSDQVIGLRRGVAFVKPATECSVGYLLEQLFQPGAPSAQWSA